MNKILVGANHPNCAGRSAVLRGTYVLRCLRRTTASHLNTGDVPLCDERAAAQVLVESYRAVGKRIAKEKRNARGRVLRAILGDPSADLDIHRRSFFNMRPAAE